MPTCHAGSEEVPTGHRLDGDPRLTLQEAGDELWLHGVHATGETGHAASYRRSLQPHTHTHTHSTFIFLPLFNWSHCYLLQLYMVEYGLGLKQSAPVLLFYYII